MEKIETIKRSDTAIIDCGNGYFRELVRNEFANSTEFALEVMECAKRTPMVDYWDAKAECYKPIKMDWQDRIVLSGPRE